MLRLTDEVGQDVCLANGARVGTLTDLVIGITASDPLVTGLVVRVARSGFVRFEWTDVVGFEHSMVQLGPNVVSPAEQRHDHLPMARDELGLVRDVLDTQIIDTNGHRVVRVGDVILTRRDDDRLAIVAVDVGFGSVLGRLGFRRLAKRFDEQVMAWGDLHLTSPRAHEAQLAERTALVHRLGAEDLAHLLSRLTTTHAGEVLAHAPVERAVGALHAVDDEVGRRVLEALPEEHALTLIDSLEPERRRRYHDLFAGHASPRRRIHRLRGWRGAPRSHTGAPRDEHGDEHGDKHGDEPGDEHRDNP